MAEATYAQFVAVQGAQLTHLPDGVDAIDAAAIPLVCLTGEQLVRLATRVVSGQTILVSGALGSVGRATVHAAKKLGAIVIAGVRADQLAQAAQLGVSHAVAIDDDAAIASLDTLDGVADTVGGPTAAKLFRKVKPGGRFGYAAAFPADAAATNPTVELTRVFARPDASDQPAASVERCRGRARIDGERRRRQNRTAHLAGRNSPPILVPGSGGFRWPPRALAQSAESAAVWRA